MGAPISVRLEDDVREELLLQARSRGIGLSTLLRDLATEAASEARRRRIREASEEIGRRVGSRPEARAFYEEWGTPEAWGVLRGDCG